MKRTHALFLIAGAVVLSSVFTGLYLTRNELVAQETYRMELIVADDDILGFKVDNDAFYFGSMGPGAIAERTLLIRDVPEDVIVQVRPTGPLADWMTYETGFPLSEGEEKDIDLTVTIPEDAAYGNYTGTVTITLVRQ